MNEEARYALNKLQSAIGSLKEGVTKARDDLDKDGVIQRFEFTFELLWKGLKVFLELQGIRCATPKDCLRGGFKAGLIENEDVFLKMLEDRNKTSHLYDQTESERIFKGIQDSYLPQMENLASRLEKIK
ncbi:MAG: nucleotidyltransferase substrate binding protein [Bacteroidia bacterium]|nr:nucleotidyltransferase substrate binding protein [Bacteroidia bacterium]